MYSQWICKSNVVFVSWICCIATILWHWQTLLVLVSLWICFGLWCAICLIWDWLHGINCSWASSDLQNKLHIEHQLTQKKSRRKTRCTVTMKFNLHSGLNVVRSHSCSSTYKYLLLADCIFSITFVILVKLCPEQLTFEWCLLTNHYAKLTRACFFRWLSVDCLIFCNIICSVGGWSVGPN